MSRPAFRQPTHRRPSWAKTEAMYRANLSATGKRSYGPRSDSGMDNFSYDETHVTDFEMPGGIAESLPTELRSAANTWILAAAALETALGRIQKLDADPISLCEPIKEPNDIAMDLASPIVAPPPAVIAYGADTPATSPPTSFTNSVTATVAKYATWKGYPHLPSGTIPGMDTPPFTPIDTCGLNTPANSVTASKSTMPDPASLNAHLAPLSSADTLTLSPTSPHEEEDENEPLTQEKSYEGWAKQYNAELHDLKFSSFPRVAGLDRTVDKLLVELEVKCVPETETRIAISRFRRWWRGHRGRIGKYQEKVEVLREKGVPWP